LVQQPLLLMLLLHPLLPLLMHQFLLLLSAPL